MAAPLLAGLARVGAGLGRAAATGARAGARAAARGTKKLSVKKVKSFAKDKIKNKVKDKVKDKIKNKVKDRYQKPNFKPGEGWTDSGERHRQTYFGLSSPSPLIGGTTNPLKIKPAKSSDPQVKQLKVNVTNIHRFLVKSNNDYTRQQATTRRNQTVQRSKAKLRGEERRLGKGSPLKGISSSIKSAVAPAGSIFDRILEFVGLLVIGIAVNALPAVMKKVKEVIDSVVNFLTPIQSGFNVLMSFFNKDMDQDQLDVDKKRFDDGIQNISGKGGLVDKIKEKLGPFGGLVDILKPAIDKIRESLGLKKASQKIKLERRDGKEGFVNVETGEFIQRQWTSAEREKYDGSDKSTNKSDSDSKTGQTSEGSSTGVSTKVTNLNYGLVNPTPNTDILKNKGGYAADTGLDIIGKVGDPIVSPVDGILEYAERGHTAQMGQDSDPTKPGIQDQLSFRIRLNKPFIFEGKKVNFVYGTHLATLDTKVANKFDIPIKAGQRLGTMGVANNVPHLHIGFVEDRAQTGFLNFKEVRRLLSGQSSNGAKKGASGLMKGVKKDERNKRISMINQPMDDEGTTTIAIQQVNTIQTAYVPMPIPIKQRSSQSSSNSQLSGIWRA